MSGALPPTGFWLTVPFFLTALINTVAPSGSHTEPPTPPETLPSNTMSKDSTAIPPRYDGPDPNHLTPKQQEIHDYILASRPRTGLSGPFGPWLAVPEIAEPASQLGKACRYDTSLSFRESELVILLTGAKARSETEFAIHSGEARKAGIPQGVIESIPKDDDFSAIAVEEQLIPLLENDRERAIVAFAAELLESSTVSDETYERTKAAVDGKDSVLVEITSIVGYYTYVSYTLNVFRIPAK